MSNKNFAQNIIRTIEISARSRYALKFQDCKRLARKVIGLGLGVLLTTLSVEAQNVLQTGKNPVNTAEISVSQARTVTAGQVWTGEKWEIRGIWYDVYQRPDGRKFIVRKSQKSGKVRREYLDKKEK